MPPEPPTAPLPPDGNAPDSTGPGAAPGTDSGGDAGAELLAHVRGELSDEDARRVEKRLAAEPKLRAEHERLAADLAAWQGAIASDAPAPRPDTLGAILEQVRGEAAERRAAASRAREEMDPDLGAAAVALALDALAPDEAADVERRLADDPVLRDDVRATRRLRDLTRDALAVTPRPESWEALRRLVATEGPAPVRFDSGDIPQPRSRPRRRRGILRLVPPIAAAAAAVFLLFVLSAPPDAASVVSGVGRLAPRLTAGELDAGKLDAGSWLGRGDDASFRFEDGDVLEALEEPLVIRVACRQDAGSPRATGPTRAGTAEFVLEPGARLARADAAHFDLLAGRVRVTAHDLADHLEIRSGDLYAAVRGTEFTTTFVDGHLVTVVHQGSVELGRRGGSPDSVRLAAGEQGLVDAERLLHGPVDGRDDGAAFLTPAVTLTAADTSVTEGDTLQLTGELRSGPGGSVTIAAFDASVPLFLVRLKGPGGQELDVKIQDAMLATPLPRADDDPTTWRLGPDAPYRLDLRIDGLDLEPGRWEARLRYMSYRKRASGAEWLGVVQSAPVTIEVTPR